MKISTLLIALACMLAQLIPANLLAQGPGRKAYLAGETLRKQNKCKEAIMKYMEAIRQEPTNYKYFFQKGKCEFKEGNYPEAKEAFLRTVEYKPEYTAAYSLLAKIYRNEKDYDNAIYYYEEAANFEGTISRKVQYKLLLINLLLKENRIDEAEQEIAEARKYEPDNPNLLYYQAEVDAIASNWLAAKAGYEKALATQRVKRMPPAEKAKYFYGLGIAHNELGEQAAAKRVWTKANFGPYKSLIEKQLLKENHIYFYKVAVSYYLNGAYSESNSYIEKALNLDSGFASAYALKGKIEEKSGMMETALLNYNKAIALESDQVKRAKIQVLAASLYLETKQAGKSMELLASAVETIPSNNSWKYLKAQAAFEAGQYSEAIQTLELLLRHKLDARTKAKYSFLLGRAAKGAQDINLASEAFQNALYGPFKPAARIELDNLAGKG